MSAISELDLKQQIKLRTFKRAYFIYGEEKYLVDYYTKTLTDKILLTNSNSFNLQDFFYLDLDIDKLEDAIEALPLMSPVKCVRVFDFDVEKENQNNMKRIKEIIANVPDSVVLIVSLKNLNINAKKSSKWTSFIKFFDKYGETLNLPSMNKSKLQRQLIKWADKLSCQLSEKNAELIIEKCGSNLLVLKHELEKLCAFVNKSEITNKDISNVVIESFETNVFELTKAVIAQDYDKALNLLDTLLDKKEEPVSILSVMASNYIDLYRVKTAEQNGKSIDDLATIFDYKRKMFRLENARRNSKNFSMNYIRKCINLIAKTDEQLKRSRLKSRTILEKFIVKLSII